MEEIITKTEERLAKDSITLEVQKLVDHIGKTDEEIGKIMLDIMNGSITTVEKVFERLHAIQMKHS